jgi:putative peptide zinc metalloprotease protein
VERQFLVQRRDGQAIQLSELLYLIVAAAGDGRSTEELTADVGRISGRKLSVVALIHLIDQELVPLGLIENIWSG